MDNKEAIKIINQYDMNFHWNDGEPIPAEQLVEAFDLAIAAMEQQEKAYDEWCTDCKEYDHNRHCCPRYNRVIRGAVDEVKQQRWIPVTERLPEKEGCYLVSVKNDHQRKYSKTAWFNDGSWTMVRQKVLAWRPLPEPYQEDKA